MKALVLFFSSLIFGFSSQAQGKITWAFGKFEPFYISEGPMKEQGIGDRLRDLLQKDMPEFQHEATFMPILRVRESLKTGGHALTISFIKDPSLSEFVQYSAAPILVPALQLPVRREDWVSKWKSADSISLVTLMKNGGVVGVAEGRRYGKNLDSLLSNRSRFPKGVYSRIGNQYAGLAEMVKNKHVDATIGYSAELRFAQKSSSGLDGLVSVPVAESMEPLYAYAALPKGEWGDAIRVRLNKSLLNLRGTPEYKKAQTDWFGTSAAWEREYKQRFLAGKMDAQEDGL